MQEIGKSSEKFAKRLQKPLYEFGPFRVDPQNRLLLRDGQPLPLTGKPFDILLALLEHPGQLLTKDELLARVWPDAVVEEGNLGRSISSLRKALDDSPDEHRYIVTLSRHGYRFVGDVRECWQENGTAAAGPAEIMPFPAPGPRPLPSAGGHRRLWFQRWWIAAVVALLAVGIAGYEWTRGRGRHAVEPAMRQITANPTEDWLMGAAISPDGKYLAFRDHTGLYLRTIDSGESRSVPLPPEWRDRNVTGLRWFPDGGELIASVPGSDCFDIWAIAAVGQAAPRLIQRCGSWSAISPDGLHIAFRNGDYRMPPGKELRVSGINDQSPRTLAVMEGGDLAYSPVWSPDGNWVAYVRGPGTKMAKAFPRTAAIEIRPAGGGAARTVLLGSRLPESIALLCINGRGCLVWSPDGRLFFTATASFATDLTRGSYSIWAVPVELRGGVAGEPVRVAQWADFYPDCLTLTLDGKRLAFLKGGLHSDVYVGELSADGNKLDRARRLTRDDHGFGSDPNAWMRDGRIIFSSDQNGKTEVFRQGMNEKVAQALVRDPGDEQEGARLSPDGSWILYMDHAHSASRMDSMPKRLMRVPAAGGSPELVLQMPASAHFDFRCPLKSGACVLSQDQGNEILFYPLDPVRGKEDRLLGKRVRSNWGYVWDVSPDGSSVAAVDAHSSVLTLSGGAWHELPLDERWGGLASIAWTADGKGFFVTSSKYDLFHVTTAGKVHVLAHNDFSQWLEHPVVSPDGKYLAFQAQTNNFNAWMIENP